MKRKLLLAALFVVSALGFNAKAQFTDGGTYYLENKASGHFISSGHNWFTRSTLCPVIDYPITLKASGDKYILGTYSTASLGHNLYIDNGDNNAWIITPVAGEDKVYTISSDGINYLGYDGTFVLSGSLTDPTNDAAKWYIRSKDDYLANFTNASPSNPVEASFFITGPCYDWTDPNRNNAWTNDNFVIGTNLSRNGSTTAINPYDAERWQGKADINQTLTGLPAGVYAVGVQGFYRDGGPHEAASNWNNKSSVSNAFLYAGEESVPLVSICKDAQSTNGKGFETNTSAGYLPNNMSGAGETFAYGHYKNVLYVRVEANQDLKIGVKKTAEIGNDWVIIDNWTLKYCGDVSLAEVLLVEYVKAYNEAMDAAKAYQSVNMFDEDKTALNTAITTNTLDLNATTAEGLTTATENLNKATAEAELAAAKYATYATANSLINGGTNVDLTSLLKNPSFEADASYALVSSWTNEGVGIQGQNNDGFNGYRVGTMFAERWANNTPIAAFKTYQTVSPLPAGIYEVSAVATFNGTGATLFANENSVTVTDVNRYSVLCHIDEMGEITLGVQGVDPTGSWFKVDDFQLKYIGTEFPAYTLVTGKMESAVATAQTAAETAFKNNKTVENYNALLAAIDDAQASVDAYTSAAKYFPKMKAVLDNTNVYTQEAYNAKYGTWLAAYNDNTLETSIAATLTENSAYSAGWHATNNIDDILLSTWTVGGEAAYEYDKALYINTWSIEGDSDGSNMSAPFFEYWIGDGEKLADNELVSTLPVEDGLYKFTALVRVVNKKTDEGNAGYDGISFQVNDGDVVPFTTGSEVIMDGKTVGIAATVEAQGLVKDGNLVIKAIVSGTNASWLSMKDFKYTKVRDLTEEEKAVVPTEITLDKTEVALNTETATATLVPTFSPDNANTTVTWASSDATVATVDANGVVTALSSGTTTITVASTLNPEVKATATVTVTFPETSSSYINEGPKRTITTVTGNNLIKNGTFEYPNGFYGWTNAAGGALGSDKFDLVAEDGNVYLKAKTNEGAGGAGSIGTLWPIVAGKTYEFGYRVKGNPGNTDYQKLAMTNAPTSDEAKDGEIVSGTVTVANSWTYVKYEFTNTAEYAYLQFRARWLDSNQCFDDFYLVEKGGTTTTEEGNVEYATAAIPTANVGNGVFQYSQTAVDATKALVQGTATVEEVQNAYNALQVLNAPSADVAYKIYQKNGFTFGEETVVAGAPITFVEGGNAEDDGYYGLSWQYADNVNYAQALNFTNVEGNLYKISFVDVDGTTRYIATQKGAGYKEGTRTDRLRVTTDAEKALKVEVIPTTTDGLFNFKNTEHGSLIGGTDFGVFTTNSNAALAVKVAEEAVVTLNSDGGYYTLMLPFAAELPTGMKAYTCAEVDGNVLTLTEATSFAPNTPYIVVEGAGDYTFSGYGLATADSYTEGLLKGAYAQTDVPAGRYVLAVKPGETDAKFYVVGDAGAKLPAYRAYLTVANSEVKAFTIGRGDATGISAIEALQNGDAEIYTINGTRVNTLQKGINIVKMSNGKTQKVLVK